ncbi:MAG TPA: glutamate decarboxylase [Acidimicrobiia bacterium]|jgi:glutamate decarboxylase|nr:glutamate decarboxylase [Acidimicrobiia bacterium]
MAVHSKSESPKTAKPPPSALNPIFARGGESSAPRFEIPQQGMRPDTAYQVIHDELMLDGNARLNLATFVTTWMEPEAERLMVESFDKNMVDKDEYPRTADLEMRCVNMLSRLWHSPEGEEATGTSTTGSSEAAMLGGMALKWRWRERMRSQGKSTERPNLVAGINVQVCWEKFCRYWDVEMRLVPMEGDRFTLNGEEAVKRCDENTIGVVPILGSTFDGSYEPVADICAALDQLQAETGLDVPVHVDGASGAFVAPFIDPDLVWDFRLPRVQSINASGHKYGLVYPGVGWVVWRKPEALPEDLVFRVNYLGGEMPTFALNFSRPGNQIVAQYYNLIRLGFEGYRRVQQASRDVAMELAERIAAMGRFRMITDGSNLPVIAFSLADDDGNYSVFDVSKLLREGGWLVPAYTFPENREDLAVLRVVVRNGFSQDLADFLIDDLKRALQYLDKLETRLPPVVGEPFHH